MLKGLVLAALLATGYLICLGVYGPKRFFQRKINAFVPLAISFVFSMIIVSIAVLINEKQYLISALIIVATIAILVIWGVIVRRKYPLTDIENKEICDTFETSMEIESQNNSTDDIVADKVESTTGEPQNEQAKRDVTQFISKEPKIMYCKKCGNVVDSVSKKCTSCGKQYFNIKRFWKPKIIIPCLVAITLLTSIGFNIGLAVNNNSLNKSVNSLSGIVKSQKDRIDDLQSNLDAEKIKNADNREKIRECDFYHENAVIVADNGTNKYHKYGCEEIRSSSSYITYKIGYSYWIFNVEAAESRGYYACPRCH